MKKDLTKFVVPNKRINYFTVTILLLGVICGCIFLVILSKEDKLSIINQITAYFKEIKANNISIADNFKNNIIINLIYISSIWILGLSIIGIILNIFIIFIKGFITGFTLSSILITFKIKGILLDILYLIFGQVITLIAVIGIGIYSITFSINIIKLIFNKNKEQDKRLFKKYIIMLIISIIVISISTVLESILLPNIYKLIINWYI